MSLSKTQRDALHKIGLAPGTNAFAIAKELERDQSGINKICKMLHKKKLVSVTKGENVKTVRVNELRLTLLGFALVVDTMYRGSSVDADGRDPSPEYHSEFSSLLHNNQDLHEALDIFAEYFSFATEGNTTALKSHWATRPLWAALERHTRAYEFVSTYASDTELGRENWDIKIYESLYRDLFFRLWDQFTCYGYHEEEVDFFSTELAPRFKESKGRFFILDEMIQRESECDRLKTLRSLI
ncbi:MAG: hypothetical protein CVV31_09195 [Methanomicrobiales archaeon HGW-Methanomicrobiales-2]|jgi:hypothetical protein|nr:MAG: hypothetical protein CVV31_09195 [Methanomicrobiales archaeon HGW-Methanomicrobiales-2]